MAILTAWLRGDPSAVHSLDTVYYAVQGDSDLNVILDQWKKLPYNVTDLMKAI